MRKLFIVVVLLCFSSLIFAQHEDEIYVPETDSLVLKKLDEWQGLKFGLLMHWGAYSQWGIVESWSICPEDYGWCERKKGSNPQNYNEYVKEYEGLQKTFNPLKFDPQKWASAAADAGMRYVVFTTKHHDGFSMFDSKYTDYKVTDPSCPFNSNPKAKFDIILLDRDCKLAGSFHVLNLEKFGADKVISISSVPEYNDQAQKRGVTKVILKDYQYLDDFADKVVKAIGEIVSKMSLIED